MTSEHWNRVLYEVLYWPIRENTLRYICDGVILTGSKIYAIKEVNIDFYFSSVGDFKQLWILVCPWFAGVCHAVMESHWSWSWLGLGLGGQDSNTACDSNIEGNIQSVFGMSCLETL